MFTNCFYTDKMSIKSFYIFECHHSLPSSKFRIKRLCMFIKFHPQQNFQFIFSATSFNIFTILCLKKPTNQLTPNSSTRLLIYSQSKLIVQILLILPRIHLLRFNHTNTQPTTQNPLKPPTTGLFPTFSPFQTTSHC